MAARLGLADAGARTGQKTKSVLAALHIQERLDLAAHHELVAEKTVVGEMVVDEKAVAVEQPVLDNEADVEIAARQTQRRRRVRLVPGVEGVEGNVEPGEPPIDVLRRDIDGVVVVPHRRVLVLQEAALRSVRIEIVSRLAEAERVQRVAVVLGVLEALMPINGGDGLADVEPPLHQIVDEPDEPPPSPAASREPPAPC